MTEKFDSLSLCEIVRFFTAQKNTLYNKILLDFILDMLTSKYNKAENSPLLSVSL